MMWEFAPSASFQPLEKRKKKMNDQGGPHCDHERLLKDNLQPPAAGKSQEKI